MRNRERKGKEREKVCGEQGSWAELQGGWKENIKNGETNGKKVQNKLSSSKFGGSWAELQG